MDYMTTDLPDNREQTGKLLDDILHHFISSVHKAGKLLYKTKKGFQLFDISRQVNTHIIRDNQLQRLDEIHYWTESS